jgi:hypothetical protein
MVTAAKPDHDALYQRFFSDPAVVAQLLREFVAGDWLDGLDLWKIRRTRASLSAWRAMCWHGFQVIQASTQRGRFW